MAFNIFGLTNPKASTVKTYAITIPTTVVKNVCNCDDAGDTYAAAVYTSNTGNYAKLKDAFDQINALCKGAKGKDGLKSTGVKNALSAAITATSKASADCTTSRKSFEDKYLTTKDIYNMMERDEEEGEE